MMRWTFLILTLWLVYASAESAEAGTGCSPHQALQSILDPQEYYSATRRIQREQSQLGNEWAQELYFEELKRSTPLEVKMENYVNGVLEKKFFRGYVIHGNSKGTAIERYADAIKKKDGLDLVISDDALEWFKAEGGLAPKMTVRSLNGKVNAKIDAIMLNSDILFETRFPTLIPHESTHGYFQKLSSIGKGKSHSIVFQDFNPIKEGEFNFYQNYQSLEEQLTWVQDLVRESRISHETKVQQLFRQSGSVTPTKVIRFDRTQLTYTRKILEQSKPKIETAMTAIRNQQAQIEKNFEKLALKANGKPRTQIKIDYGKNQRVEVPINTQQEWDLIAKYGRSDEAGRSKIKKEMIEIWQGKLEQQRQMNANALQSMQKFERYYHTLSTKEKITYEEYRQFRAYLTQLASDLRIKSVSSP